MLVLVLPPVSSRVWFSRGLAVSMGEAAKLVFLSCRQLWKLPEVSHKMLVFLYPRVLSCGACVSVASPCPWGKLENLSFSNVSKQVVMLFCVADVALCDIPTCLIMCRKCHNYRKSRTKRSFFCIHVSCLCVSFSCGVVVSMGEAAKHLLFECFHAGCHVVLHGRRGTLWHSNLFDWSIHFILLHRRMWFPTQDISCVIRSSRMASMSWKALLAARHCVATPVLLSRRENRSGAMTLFHCFTIGLSIDIFISYHNRYFNIGIFNIRVSIRVRGLHLVSFFRLQESPEDPLAQVSSHPHLLLHDAKVVSVTRWWFASFEVCRLVLWTKICHGKSVCRPAQWQIWAQIGSGLYYTISNNNIQYIHIVI